MFLKPNKDDSDSFFLFHTSALAVIQVKLCGIYRGGVFRGIGFGL